MGTLSLSVRTQRLLHTRAYPRTNEEEEEEEHFFFSLSILYSRRDIYYNNVLRRKNKRRRCDECRGRVDHLRGRVVPEGVQDQARRDDGKCAERFRDQRRYRRRRRVLQIRGRLRRQGKTREGVLRETALGHRERMPRAIEAGNERSFD